MKKKIVKLRFRKWWMYFVPSLRRWLRECEQVLSDKLREEETEHKRYEHLFGWRFPHTQSDLPDRIKENRKDIVDYFGMTHEEYLAWVHQVNRDMRAVAAQSQANFCPLLGI